MVGEGEKQEMEAVILTDDGEVILQDFAIGFVPGVCQRTVLGSTEQERNKVDKHAEHDCDLHVVAGPVAAQVGWDLHNRMEPARSTSTMPFIYDDRRTDRPWQIVTLHQRVSSYRLLRLQLQPQTLQCQTHRIHLQPTNTP